MDYFLKGNVWSVCIILQHCFGIWKSVYLATNHEVNGSWEYSILGKLFWTVFSLQVYDKSWTSFEWGCYKGKKMSQEFSEVKHYLQWHLDLHCWPSFRALSMTEVPVSWTPFNRNFFFFRKCLLASFSPPPPFLSPPPSPPSYSASFDSAFSSTVWQLFICLCATFVFKKASYPEFPFLQYFRHIFIFCSLCKGKGPSTRCGKFCQREVADSSCCLQLHRAV